MSDIRLVGNLKTLITVEERYSKAVIEYFRIVYETELMRYKFIKNKIWRMKHNNPQEYKAACELLGVNSLFDKY